MSEPFATQLRLPARRASKGSPCWRAGLVVRPFLGLFVLGALSAGSAHAGEYEQKQGPAVLRIEADKIEDGKIEIRLSDKLRLTLTVEGPATLEVKKPAVLTQSKSWQVRRLDEPEKVALTGGGLRWRQAALIEPDTKGDLSLQIAPIRYRREAGKGDWQTIKWQPVTIHVTTSVVRADPTQARDITPPEAVPEAKSPWKAVLIWTGFALLAVGLVLGALELKRRLAPARPEQPPHEWALRELDRLEGLGLAEHGQAERFHTFVSDLIRRYLELRYHLRAPRQTTAEFLEAMRQAPQLSADQRILLREFLERCDLAKFARTEYSTAECKLTSNMARNFVEQTKPAPEPAPAATATAR
jgi:hypothetical protein